MNTVCAEHEQQPRTGYGFPRKMRLIHTRQFESVYKANVRTSVGPLVVWAAPNELGHPRLGLAVPRRVGTAVVRNRIKRVLRQAFRLMQHDFPRGYDVVVSVRRHDLMTLAEYQGALLKAARSLHLKWSKKLDKPNDGG